MADVLVLGAGAVGSVLGAFLARAGDRVTLLGRNPHMEAIERHGLRVTGLFGEFRISGLRALSDPRALDGLAECVWITVKSPDTAAVAPLAACWRAPQAPVISAQNGIGNLEILARHVPASFILGARVIFGARIVEPGTVEVTVSAEPVRLGAYLRDDSQAAALARGWAEHLAQAGLECEWSADIQAELWAKLLYNAALNPLGALLGCHYGQLAALEDTRAIMDEVVREAFAVARGVGVSLPWNDADQYLRHFYERLVPATYRHRSSMLQDIERGRITEIEAMNGAIWRLGEQLGQSVPRNEMLTRLIRARSAALRQKET
jgi:2-dehydropantoate 2-reductase